MILTACLLQGCAPVATKDAGEETSMAQERVDNEAYKEDRRIETSSVDRIYQQFRILIHVNVTSFNRHVLISGEVPDEAIKTSIEKIVSGIEGVRHLNNELVISGNSSLASRSSDSMITSNVKMRLTRDKNISADRIKVVAENGTVFLMGNVQRAEGDATAEIASTTNRVMLVVKLFEYSD
jgi:osmotically-inducible protein OsmY